MEKIDKKQGQYRIRAELDQQGAIFEVWFPTLAACRRWIREWLPIMRQRWANRIR